MIYVTAFISGLVVGVIAFRMGFLAGVKIERARVTHVFDVAREIVSSGALGKVRRRIENGLTDEQLRSELHREMEYREQQRHEERRVS